jgi:hypothetical protein
MRPRAIVRGLSVGLALLGMMLFTTAGLLAAPSAEAVALATGDAVEVHAHGFQGGEVVTAWLTGPSGQVIGANDYFQTTDQGAVSFRVRLDAATEAGRWMITVHGLDSRQAAYAQIDKQATGGDDADDEEDDDGEDDDEDSEDEDDDSDTDDDGDTD